MYSPIRLALSVGMAALRHKSVLVKLDKRGRSGRFEHSGAQNSVEAALIAFALTLKPG